MRSRAVEAALARAASGELDAARAALRAHVARHAGDVEALCELALLDLRAGDRAKGLYGLRRAGERGDARAWYMLGREHAGLKDWAAAEEALGRSVEINPREPLAWGELAHARLERGDEEGALGAAGSASRHAPGHPDAARQEVRVRLLAGDHEGARDACRRILGEGTRDVMALHTCAYAMNSLPGLGEDEVQSAHARLGAAVEAEMGGRRPAPARRPPGSGLRVGLVGPDFRRHSCAYFLLGLLPALAERGAALFLYSTSPARDEFTRRFETMGAWRSLAGLDAEAACAAVRGDGLDVAIDLAGATSLDQLRLFARRPAPVLVSYLGYPNSSGLGVIDARLVDEATDPEGSGSLERLVRLPGPFVRFRSQDGAAVERAPGEGVRFGSFNAGTKITGEVMRAWGEVLRRAPGSTLTLKRHALSPPAEARHRRVLESMGVAGGRLRVLDFAPTPAAHLEDYRHVDVGLDTFPYAGTTTPCEALWMGVPVVTLAGASHRGRVGVSLLRGAGRGEWVAGDVEEYVSKAAALAGQAHDAASRAALRERVGASAVCDAGGLAGAMVEALREEAAR